MKSSLVHSKKSASTAIQKKTVHRKRNIDLYYKKIEGSPYTKKYKRYIKQGIKSLLLSPIFHSSFKIILTAGMVVGMLYGSYIYIGKTFANEVVISQSEIIARVARLTSLPNEEPFEIVRVQDEEDLRKQNSFYKNIKEGDYILMYKNMAIIYDLRNNSIVRIIKN